MVSAEGAGAGDASAGYFVEGVIEGPTTFVGTPTVTVLAEDDPCWT